MDFRGKPYGRTPIFKIIPLEREKALIQSLKGIMQFIGLILISAWIAVSLVN